MRGAVGLYGSPVICNVKLDVMWYESEGQLNCVSKSAHLNVDALSGRLIVVGRYVEN